MADFTVRSPWKFETSEEKAVSIFGTLASGVIYLKEENSGEKLAIHYRSASVGAGKGPPVNVSWSATSDPSGAFDNVAVRNGYYFGPMSFPCRGYIFGVGASGSALLGMQDDTGTKPLGVSSGGVTCIVFGMWPWFAGLRTWGFSKSVTPGAGISAGLATFQTSPW